MLKKEQLEWPGMSSPKFRKYLNKLCKDKTYLEVGTYRGSTLLAATYKNGCVGVAIDNSAKFGNHGWEVRRMIDKFDLDATYIDADYRDVLGELDTYDVVFYDGDHKTRSTREALELLWPKVNDGGCFIMDDYDYCTEPHNVKGATDRWIKQHGIKNFEFYRRDKEHDMDGWWNGCAVIWKK